MKIHLVEHSLAEINYRFESLPEGSSCAGGSFQRLGQTINSHPERVGAGASLYGKLLPQPHQQSYRGLATARELSQGRYRVEDTRNYELGRSARLRVGCFYRQIISDQLRPGHQLVEIAAVA